MKASPFSSSVFSGSQRKRKKLHDTLNSQTSLAIKNAKRRAKFRNENISGYVRHKNAMIIP